MEDKGKNLLRAIFFLIFTLGCILLMLSGKTNRSYPIVGALLGAGLTIGFFRSAFRR